MLADNRRAGWHARLAGLLAGLLLIATLFGQFLVHERERLATHPELRAWGDAVCRHLRCREPTGRVPAAIRVETLTIQQRAAGRIQVEFALVNTLERAQPWPLLEIALSDRHGRVLAQGRWLPTEYLGPEPAARTMDGGARNELRLELATPTHPAEGVMVWPL